MELYSIIKRPVFTEKGTAIKDAQNKVMIEVDRRANKVEIKKAVEEIFKVKVKDVNTILTRPKRKMRGRQEGFTSATKKAIVTLKKGEKLDFIEGA